MQLYLNCNWYGQLLWASEAMKFKDPNIVESCFRKLNEFADKDFQLRKSMWLSIN